MRRLKSLFSKHPLVTDFFQSLVPEALRFDIYFKQRREILDKPGKTQSALVKRPLFYACFCMLGPVAVLYAILSFGQAISIIAPSQLDQSLNDLRQLENNTNNMISGVCHRHFPNDPDIVLACISRLQSQKGYDKADLDDAIAMATYSQRFVNTFQTNTLFLGPVILIVNTYFFAYLWARVFRVHVNPTGKDREGIRHAYLVTMGTTLLIPSIIATFTILVSELIQRSGVPWTLISFAPTIAFFANLPIFVAMMLTAQRLHRLLNKAEDWRIGKPVAIMLLSNLLTCIVVFPLIAILIVWL